MKQTWFTMLIDLRSCSWLVDARVVREVRVAVAMVPCVAAGDQIVAWKLVRRCVFMPLQSSI